MAIPLVDLKAQYAPLKDEILSGISQVFDGMHLFLGENVQALEKEFAEFCGVKHGIGVVMAPTLFISSYGRWGSARATR